MLPTLITMRTEESNGTQWYKLDQMLPPIDILNGKKYDSLLLLKKNNVQCKTNRNSQSNRRLNSDNREKLSKLRKEGMKSLRKITGEERKHVKT